MIIVEQSLNVALAIADRAIFLEKGEVRFEGAAQRAARTRRPRPRRVLRDRGRLMLARYASSRCEPAFIGLDRRPDHRADRDGHRARLPLEPGHQLRGRRPRRARGRAARGHGRQVHGWPYWPALVAALLVGTLIGRGGRARGHPPAVQGAARDRARRDDRRRRARARRSRSRCPTTAPARSRRSSRPRSRRSGSSGTTSTVDSGSQLLALIVVPIITLGLWWLLGHTRFGDAVRAVGDERRPRPADRHQPEADVDRVWTIAGFLSAIAVILYATDAGHRPSSSRSGPTRCCSASPPR